MKGGFTLIELVVVLLILALLTHLAVRELGAVQRAKMRATAERQLEEVCEAVWRARPGEEPTGFLVDMGRLPRAVAATNASDRVAATLSELWKRPADVEPFALRAAVVSNLAAGVSREIADASVKIPCGWRGPYLRLPFGHDRLLDPWGNPFETPDDAGFARLVGTNGVAAAEGNAVLRVRQWGADGRPDDAVEPADAADRDAEVELLSEDRLANPLVVHLSFVEGTAPKVVAAGEVRCRWYMPRGAQIVGGAWTNAVAAAAATAEFADLPPGVCTLVVQTGAAGGARAVERIVVPPGGRVVSWKVSVP